MMVDEVVSERRPASGPKTLETHCAPFVTDTIASKFAFKLRESKQHIHHQPPEAVRRIEILSDTCERRVVSLKNIHKPDEVQEAPTQPIELVDDDDINLAAFDVSEELSHRGAIQGAPGLGSIFVSFLA